MLKSWLPEKWDYVADVVIVGYGGAGAPAAIACHDKGAKALLLEKAPFGGGNMCCAGGGSTIPSDVNKGIQYYRALTAGMVDEDLITHVGSIDTRPPAVAGGTWRKTRIPRTSRDVSLVSRSRCHQQLHAPGTHA